MRNLGILGIMLTAACNSGGGGGSVKLSDYSGDWTGSWSNTTFESTGDATMHIEGDDDSADATVTLDLNGPVFGAGDPDPIDLTGPTTTTGFTVGGEVDLLGMVSIMFDLASGEVLGSSEPGQGDIASLSFEGTAEPDAVDLTYTIYNTEHAEFATGTLEFTK